MLAVVAVLQMALVVLVVEAPVEVEVEELKGLMD
jgi:hypothetical protein